jgi:hypothetical protein
MIILPSSRGVALRVLALAEAICVPAQNNFLKQRVDSFGLTPSAPVVKLPEAPAAGRGAAARGIHRRNLPRKVLGGSVSYRNCSF